MSRARPLKNKDGDIVAWVDVNRNGERATPGQLELLSTVLDVPLDDLLDESLTQGEVVKRLHTALGNNPIPQEVLDKREAWRQQRQAQPKCRICSKEGDSTKHHFVNKWILKELEGYAKKWADRSKNCIPVCIDCHRDLHFRDDEDKSITPYLNDREKQFAHEAIRALIHEKPRLFELLLLGDSSVYESQLICDWCNGLFVVEEIRTQLRLVA